MLPATLDALSEALRRNGWRSKLCPSGAAAAAAAAATHCLPSSSLMPGAALPVCSFAATSLPSRPQQQFRTPTTPSVASSSFLRVHRRCGASILFGSGGCGGCFPLPSSAIGMAMREINSGNNTNNNTNSSSSSASGSSGGTSASKRSPRRRSSTSPGGRMKRSKRAKFVDPLSGSSAIPSPASSSGTTTTAASAAASTTGSSSGSSAAAAESVKRKMKKKKGSPAVAKAASSSSGGGLSKGAPAATPSAAAASPTGALGTKAAAAAANSKTDSSTNTTTSQTSSAASSTKGALSSSSAAASGGSATPPDPTPTTASSVSGAHLSEGRRRTVRRVKKKKLKRSGASGGGGAAASTTAPITTGSAAAAVKPSAVGAGGSPSSRPSPTAAGNAATKTSSATTGTTGSTAATASSATPTTSSSARSSSKLNKNPLLFPDHRERVLSIFQQLLDVNQALGEVYKSKSYAFALHELRRGDRIFKVLPPNLVPIPEHVLASLEGSGGVAGAGGEDADEKAYHGADMMANLQKRQKLLNPAIAIPGVGDKLRRKVVEILTTGDLEEMHAINNRPEVRAMREICEVHGFGPRTALALYQTHKVKTVAELRRMSAGPNPRITLNDAQKLGLVYYDDIKKRIPHAEGKLHEAYLKQRLRKHFGDAFSLTVCGSFRRQTAESGDIDVLLTPNEDSKGKDPSGGVSYCDAVQRFVGALREDGYIEATFALGSTKFMGMSRLHQPDAAPSAAAEGGKKLKKKSQPTTAAEEYPARRLDVRFVDAASFPAALLYFTGSKNFNVVMRAKAVKKQQILNEYGLFRQPTGSHPRSGSVSGVNELITKLTKYQYWSRGEKACGEVTGAKQKEFEGLVKQLNTLRVKVKTEKDLFAALDMPYVLPPDRCM